MKSSSSFTPKRLILAALLLVLSWSCGSSPASSPGSPTSSSPTVTSIAVAGVTTLSGVGQTAQLTATATLSDGTTQNVTALATWASSNTAIATVSSGGLVTAVTSGSVTITATYQGKSSTATITLSFSTSTGNTMTATIDGVPFSSIVVTTIKTPIPNLPSGVLGVAGTNAFTGTYLVLTIAVPAAVGTYQLGPGTVPNGSLHQNNVTSSVIWDTLVAGGSGTVTVTTLTASSASGTFSLTLVPNGGVGGTPTGTKTIANGVFNVTF